MPPESLEPLDSKFGSVLEPNMSKSGRLPVEQGEHKVVKFLLLTQAN